jgi:hypothetical protein
MPDPTPTKKPEPKAKADPVAFKFTPINPGDFISGVPQRDLTAEDVANLGPLELHAATAPGPTGKAMYTAVKKEGDA